MTAVRVSNHPVGVNSTDAQPPLSNRGVTMRKTRGIGSAAVSLDWLRYSVPWPSQFVVDDELVLSSLSDLSEAAFKAAVMPSAGLSLSGEVLSPPKGYNARLGLSHGSLRFHSDRPGQKIGVEFTGRDLSGLRSVGADPVALLGWIAAQSGGNVTRLDVAVDWFGKADVLDVHRAFRRGKLRTSAQSAQLVEGHRRTGSKLVSNGATVYVGSPRSDRYLRVYDKAAEQGETGRSWTRIELELGGRRAAALAGLLAADPDRWEDVARAAVRQFCEAPSVGWFTAALTGPVVKLPELGRRDSDRKRWLLHQVLPALRAELVESELVGDWELVAGFYEALAPYLARAGMALPVGV